MLVGEHEIFKEHPDEFGGFSTKRFPADELSKRLCCAGGCSTRAKIQISVPGGFMPICGLHAVVANLLILSCLGDPLPAQGAKEYAERLDVDWSQVIASEPHYPTTPEKFTCLSCGGKMSQLGDAFGRKQYLHDCEG